MRHQHSAKRTRTILLAAGMLFAASCTTTRQPHNGSASQPGGDTAALYHKRWVLAGFPDTTFILPEKDMYLLFEQATRQITGFGGCNGLRGQFRLQEKSLHMTGILSTRMWCNNGPAESRFLQALERTNTYQILGDSMRLLDQEEPLAHFYAVYLH